MTEATITGFVAGALAVIILELAVVGIWVIYHFLRGMRAERERQQRAIDAITAGIKSMNEQRSSALHSHPSNPPVLFPGNNTMN